jgi:hypothetical protein
VTFHICSAHHLLCGAAPVWAGRPGDMCGILAAVPGAGVDRDGRDAPPPRSIERRGLGVEPRAQAIAGFNFARCAANSSRHASPVK